MELIKTYLEIRSSSPSSIQADAEAHGWHVGTASDGMRSVEFICKEFNVNMSSTSTPIHGLGESTVSHYYYNRPLVELRMEISLEKNETFLMFTQSSLPLSIRINNYLFKEAFVRNADYTNDLIGFIRLEASGYEVL
jgi:hypothetical protein